MSEVNPNILSDMQLMYATFMSIINKSADKNIPSIKLCKNPQANFKPKPYWSPYLSKLVAERRLALKTFRRNPTPNNLAVLEDKTLKAKQEIRTVKIKSWQTLCSAIDGNITSTEMWRKMRWFKGYKQSNPYVPTNKREELLNNLAPDSVQNPKPLFTSNNALLL